MSENAPNCADDITSSVTAIWKRMEELAAMPATDDQLARIWPDWNALPKDMLPEEKCRVLTFEDEIQSYPKPQRSAHALELQKQLDFLPLEKHEYNQALNRVCRWARLVGFIQTTFELHKKLVE